MTSPDLDSLKAIVTDPRTDWQCNWTYDEFVQGGFSKRLCEEIATILNAAPALIAELERLRGDNEATDGTDAAHPSYWRGCDATFAAMSEQLRKILDGEDDCSGVCNEPWDALRKRVLKLRGEIATAKAIGAAEMCEQIRAEHKTDDGGFDFEGLMYWLDQTAREKKAEAAELRKKLA